MSKSSQEPVAARRIPTQSRSKQRVDRILHVAAELFAERGFAAVTMESIAKRAKTSIGSVYQFFPNKLAIFHGIAERVAEEESAIFERVIGGVTNDTPREEVLDAIVDGYADYHEASPMFRAIWSNWQFSPDLIEASISLADDYARRTEAAFAMFDTVSDPKRRKLVARVAVEIVSAMLLLAARTKKTEARAIVDETKLVLRRYLIPERDGEAPIRVARPVASKPRASKKSLSKTRATRRSSRKK